MGKNEEREEEHMGSEKVRGKSNRLKTEPDESFKSTFRKPGGEFKFGIIKYTES